MAAGGGGGESILLVEPFYGGSHRQLVDLLSERIPGCIRHTLSAKKWQWRARTAALHFSVSIAASPHYRTLFTSSVLNLAELVALRSDLAPLRKVVYFHENQLVYPVVRRRQERDFQFAYNQILSCLVADVVVFNSTFNLTSFLNRVDAHLRTMPDHRPRGVADRIRPKCRVVSFPIDFPPRDGEAVQRSSPSDEDGTGDLETTPVCARPRPETGSRCSQNATATGGSQHAAGTDCSQHATGTDCPQHATGSHCSQHAQGTHPSQHALAADCSQHAVGPNCSSNASGTTHGRDATVISPACEGNRGHPQNPWLPTPGSATPGSPTPGPGRELGEDSSTRSLHIVWPHRWEHDKNPTQFFAVMFELADRKLDFRLSVVGETFTDVPAVFAEAAVRLSTYVANWGFVASRDDYYDVLRSADVVVSTAEHEFFGVAMLEAVHLGCYPLCPNRLVYPEIFPDLYLYNTSNQLRKRLSQFCRRPEIVRGHSVQVELHKYSWDYLSGQYTDLLTS